MTVSSSSVNHHSAEGQVEGQINEGQLKEDQLDNGHLTHLSSGQSDKMSQLDSVQLLLRGDLALQAIRFRKQAAEYAAAANELEQALVLAKQGEVAPLKSWLARQSPDARAFEPSSDSASRKPNLSESLSTVSIEADSCRANVRGTDSQQSANAKKEDDFKPAELQQPSVDVDEPPRRRKVSEPLSRTSRSKATLSSLPNLNEPPTPGLEAVPTEPANPLPMESKADVSRKLEERPEAEPSPDAPTVSVSSDAPSVDTPRLIFALPNPESKATHPKPRFYSSHSVIISAALHGVALLCLMIYTIKLVQEQRELHLSASLSETSTASLEVVSDVIVDPNISESSEMPTLAASDLGISKEVSLGAQADSTLGAEPIGAEVGTKTIPDWKPAGTDIMTRVSNVQFFGVQAEGTTFCFLVDKSPSMKRDGAFESAIAELMRSISSLKPNQKYYVWFFSKELDGLSLGNGVVEKYPVNATPENIQRTFEWVQSIQITDGAPPNQALTLAIEMEPDAIFLLFDGDTRIDVTKHLGKVNRVEDVIHGKMVRVPIHTIGFYSREHENMMRSIAEQNKGTYRFVPPPVIPKKKR